MHMVKVFTQLHFSTLRCLRRPQLGNVQLLVCAADFGILRFLNIKQIVVGRNIKPDMYFAKEIKSNISGELHCRRGIRYHSIPKI